MAVWRCYTNIRAVHTHLTAIVTRVNTCCRDEDEATLPTDGVDGLAVADRKDAPGLANVLCIDYLGEHITEEQLWTALGPSGMNLRGLKVRCLRLPAPSVHDQRFAYSVLDAVSIGIMVPWLCTSEQWWGMFVIALGSFLIMGVK